MPFPDGREPDDDHDRGGADEEFATVVFDEDFVRSAPIHEPTAVERLLAAAEARAEAEAGRARTRAAGDDEYYDDYGRFGPDHDDYGRYDTYGRVGEYDEYADYDEYEAGLGQRRLGRVGRRHGPARWHRTVAWVLAVLLGAGMVALAFSAVYRGASSSPKDPAPPPASAGVGQGVLTPSASPDYSQPAVSAVPRTP
ncbi:hypothetical protein GBW32_11165 [Streptomyces tsukubensis]|uniref:Uncharacterized protein n=1 Tax=Streptomyces tsukubensis TaxID=83656 RepID=A0A1V4ABK7_9ACTN|nr:hypothetical protein [Streptomyces tsukubensis]OON80817.1 hypothetical protein B1H18_10500 [Streptomyces tsukubensis]QFR97665.1 hypothetical protein GBW32_11165 [Streptomyces tsukubensis]